MIRWISRRPSRPHWAPPCPRPPPELARSPAARAARARRDAARLPAARGPLAPAGLPAALTAHDVRRAEPAQPVQCSLHLDRTPRRNGGGAQPPPGSGAPPPSAASRSRAPPPTLLRATRLDRPRRRLLQGKVVLSEADLLGCFELPTASAGQLVGVPSTRPEDRAPSEYLDQLMAQAAPPRPRAAPEPLGSAPWPQQLASGRPKAEDLPLSSGRPPPWRQLASRPTRPCLATLRRPAAPLPSLGLDPLLTPLRPRTRASRLRLPWLP